MSTIKTDDPTCDRYRAIANDVFDALVAHCVESNRHGCKVRGILVSYALNAIRGRLRYIETVVTDITAIESSDGSGSHFRLGEEDRLCIQQMFDTRFTSEERSRREV